MHIPFSPTEIHIWHTDLSDPRHDYPILAKTLSIDEHTRAGRFKFEDDQRRYVIGHGVLRRLLAAYTGQLAEAIQFEHNRYGKPHMSRSAGLHFNVSHSHDVAVFAFSAYEIGVDIELIRPFEDAREIAHSFFRPSEAEILETLPSDQRLSAFFWAWARKEAYIKALGRGLSAGLDAIDVHMGTACTDWMTVSPDYHLRDIAIHAACACAVAASTQVLSVCQYAYPE